MKKNKKKSESRETRKRKNENRQEEIRKKQEENRNNLSHCNQPEKLQVEVIVIDDEKRKIDDSKKKEKLRVEENLTGGTEHGLEEEKNTPMVLTEIDRRKEGVTSEF
ncbi:hypothetical protein LOK49_LG09G02634 [Camellia lanceoleosa]|uniref:Uncharacterized protein n=1 Tax=Camellia lanceoleosa TaxID=1840588 RepID=A0ACC0GJ70_9ERIC|nr:hypothetical protein LOK49_LG09G02634 [Camellia lanceoleosa]